MQYMPHSPFQLLIHFILSHAPTLSTGYPTRHVGPSRPAATLPRTIPLHTKLHCDLSGRCYMPHSPFQQLIHLILSHVPMLPTGHPTRHVEPSHPGDDSSMHVGSGSCKLSFCSLFCNSVTPYIDTQFHPWFMVSSTLHLSYLTVTIYQIAIK